MVLFKKFVRRHNRTAKIILSTVIGLSMAVFTLIPFSAATVAFTQYNLTSSDILSILSSSETLLSVSGTGYYSYFSDSDVMNPTDYVHEFPISTTLLRNGNYFYNVPFAISDVVNRNARMIVAFPFNYRIKGGDTFFIYAAVSSATGFTFSFLSLDNDIVSCNVQRADNVTYTKQAIVSDYYNEYHDKVYYYDTSLNRATRVAFNNNLYKYAITIDSNVDYVLVNRFSISFNYSSSYTSFRNIFLFDSLPYYYESVSDDDTLNDMINKINQTNEMLEEISGPPSQQQQAAIDQVDNQLATEYDELQEQLDIIHSPEMPTELPTEDFSNLEDEATVINNYLGDLNLLNIFNVIIPAGCAGFLIYIVLRRF